MTIKTPVASCSLFPITVTCCNEVWFGTLYISQQIARRSLGASIAEYNLLLSIIVKPRIRLEPVFLEVEFSTAQMLWRNNRHIRVIRRLKLQVIHLNDTKPEQTILLYWPPHGYCQ